MKPMLALALTVAGVTLIAGELDYLPPAPSATTPGRFVIATGSYYAAETINVTLRLDTATGRTWQLMGIGADLPGAPRAHVTGWVLVNENPVEEARALTAATRASTNTSKLPQPSHNPP